VKRAPLKNGCAHLIGRDGLPSEEIEQVLRELAALVEPVEVHFLWRPQLRDPNDEMVLEGAINGNADALITYNVADFELSAKRFDVEFCARESY